MCLKTRATYTQISLNTTLGTSQVFILAFCHFGVVWRFCLFFNYKLYEQKSMGLEFSQVLAEPEERWLKSTDRQWHKVTGFPGQLLHCSLSRNPNVKTPVMKRTLLLGSQSFFGCVFSICELLLSLSLLSGLLIHSPCFKVAFSWMQLKDTVFPDASLGKYYNSTFLPFCCHNKQMYTYFFSTFL